MKIGITGGIGSGKSFVCKVLQKYGYQVFDCDSAAKRLMRDSITLRQQLTDLIGSDAYTTDGRLNKAVVAKFLLSSPANANAIDAIVHPAVFQAFEESGLQFMESAILFESGAYKLVDKVIIVTAPKEVRIERVMARDHINRQQVEQWMNKQLPQEELIGKADFVIENDGATEIDKQVIKILEQCNKPF